jgi:hypothetical protein
MTCAAIPCPYQTTVMGASAGGQIWKDRWVTQDEIIDFVTTLPGVAAMMASRDSGAPEVAWGDWFIFYDREGEDPPDRRFPFATIVTKDYEGFDNFSQLNRPGVFRLNIAVGRHRFEDLIGYPPAEHAKHQSRFDYTALDRLLPHPVYGSQAWVSILNPAGRTSEQARSLLMEARARATERRRP